MQAQPSSRQWCDFGCFFKSGDWQAALEAHAQAKPDAARMEVTDARGPDMPADLIRGAVNALPHAPRRDARSKCNSIIVSIAVS